PERPADPVLPTIRASRLYSTPLASTARLFLFLPRSGFVQYRLSADDASDFCRWRHAGFLVMLIPLRELVEPGGFERARAALASSEREDLRPDALHTRLRSGFEERGIAVLDLQPILGGRLEEGARLFFPEGHLDGAGNHEVAVALASFLRRLGWL
ncbi:MAG: hypothetical protein ACREQQ_13630, partial [Candidatus Binatia bacterium]